MTLNDLAVFGVGEPEEPQQLSIVKRPPSYFEYEPLYTKALNLKIIRASMIAHIRGLGGDMKEPKGMKAPEISGITWEHIEKLKAQIAEKEAAEAAKKTKKNQKPKAAQAPENAPPALAAEVPPAAPPEEKPEKAAKPKELTPERRIKEWEKLKNQLIKKGYEKDDLTGYARALAPDSSQLTEEHFNQIAAIIAELDDCSPAAIKKATKEQEAKNAALFNMNCEDRVWDLLQMEVVNPWDETKYTARQVFQNLAATMSLQETRTNEHEADMKQLADREASWYGNYWSQLRGPLREELAKRRRVSQSGKVYYKPATIKLGWCSVKRSPIAGGPTCKDKDGFKQWITELSKAPEKLNEYMHTLTAEQIALFVNCFQQSISIDYRACEIAVEAGVEFPGWKIEDPDPIGEPKLYFSRPRDTTRGVDEAEDEDVEE